MVLRVTAVVLATLALAPVAAARAPARTPEGDAKLLAQLFPEDRETKARNRTGPPGLWAIAPSGWASVTAVYEAKVVSRLLNSTVVEYQTFEDPGEESGTRLGLAVIHRGAVAWRSPLVEIRGRDSASGARSSAVALRANRPRALLWSFDYSQTSMTVRESIRLFYAYQWLGGDFAEILHETAVIRRGVDASEVTLKVREPDAAGWRVIELRSLEPGAGGRLQARTRSFTFQNRAYAENRTMEDTTSHALRLLREVPAFDGAGWPDAARLPLLASLSTSVYVVEGCPGWKGAKEFSVRILGGAWRDGVLLLFRVTDATPVFFSAAPKYGSGDTTQRDLRRTDRVELVFRERAGTRAVQLALSPGNLSNVTPFASQWLPDFESVAPGVQVRARRTGAGYELLALLGPGVFARRVRLADALVCFSVVDVRDRVRPDRDCVIATAEKLRRSDYRTLNPVTR
ncbi:MAG: hypothetical protein AAB152_06910 [Candidatus Coatesbacteria bacterium]